MRVIISIFSLIIFLSSQGLTQACLKDCSHSQSAQSPQSFAHNCCDDMSPYKYEEKAPNCGLICCIKSDSFDLSFLTTESLIEKKELNHPAVTASYNYFIAAHSLQVQSMNSGSLWPYGSKVPLYIIYQKLLLP